MILLGTCVLRVLSALALNASGSLGGGAFTGVRVVEV